MALRLWREQRIARSTHHLAEEEVLLEPVEEGRWQLSLSALLFNITLGGKVTKWSPIVNGGVYHESTITMIDRVGTKEELIDYCLLLWRHHGEDPVMGRAFVKLLERVTARDHAPSFETCLAWRLAEIGCAGEKEWVFGLLDSENMGLLSQAAWAAVETAPEEAGTRLRALIRDNEANPPLEATLLHQLPGDKESLRVLAEHLAAEDVLRVDVAWRRETFPLYEHPALMCLREQSDEEEGKKFMTLGQVAERRLKQLTGEDFGKDVAAWEEWINAHVE